MEHLLEEQLEANKRMTPEPEEGAEEGPMNVLNAEETRHLNPQYWARKTPAKDMRNAKAFLWDHKPPSA